MELHSGVTVLTGPNNTGKSAVVKALRCVSENPPSAQLSRHGATKAVVGLGVFCDGRPSGLTQVSKRKAIPCAASLRRLL
ncbi:MAG: hypothetical protein WHS46_13720 [Desulfosoma sp.]